MNKKVTKSQEFDDYVVEAVERVSGWEEAGSRKRVFVEVAQIPSTSGRGVYHIKRDEQGVLSCDCPAWIYRSGLSESDERTCKHVKQFLAQGGELNEGELLKTDDIQDKIKEFLNHLEDKDFEVIIRKIKNKLQ